MAEKTDIPGERIAKVIARVGLASRREAEAWIAAGRVAVNGAVISSPALNVTAADRIVENRDTIFRALPRNLPRLISVGRLDINTEGLLLLTNDGGLARVLELPATGWLRRYRVRALGRVRQEALDRLRGGITIDGIRYGPIEATLDREQGANVWLTFGIREGKNREVRKVLEPLGLKVNRLIRVAFGPFDLGDLDDGAVREIETSELRAKLGEQIVAGSGADFDAPVLEEKPEQPSPRHSRENRRPDHRSKERPNDKKAPRRRDRAGGPRPKYPRPR